MSAEDQSQHDPSKFEEEQKVVPQITEEEIALLLEHGDLTPELEELIQQYQQATAPTEPLYPIGSHVAITFSFGKYDLLLLPAVVLSYSVESDSAEVLILTPITTNTIPCPEYFGNNKQCTGCSLSHGYSIPVGQILPSEALEETHIDHLQYGKKVWCQTSGDEVWKLGKIIDQLHGPRWRIRLTDRGRKPIIVDLEHLRPFQSVGDDVDSAEDEKEEWSESESGTESVDEEVIRANNRIARNFGIWQEHTTGFGAKMMKKMGYVEGQGLGLKGEGRVDPVEAHLGQQGVNSRPGLGLKRKNKKKAKSKTNLSVAETTEETKKSTTLTLMDSLLGSSENVKDTSKRELEDQTRVKVEFKSKQEANRALSKLQKDLDQAQKEYVNAKEAYRRNCNSPMERQFSTKLKAATAKWENAKKEFNQVSNFVKQEKRKKDMYTF